MITRLQPVKGKDKVAQVKWQCLALAQRLGSGNKLPGIRDLCHDLQVTITTVDAALRSLETEGVVVRKHGSGVYVSPRLGQKTIGLVFSRNVFRDAPAQQFYDQLLDLCRQRAQTRQERFSLYVDLADASERPSDDLGHWELLEDLQNRKLHGILRVCDLPADVLRCTSELNIPVAGLHTSGPHDDPLTVGIDWRELVRMGVESLAQQGCKTLGLITPFGFWRTPENPNVLRQEVWNDDIRAFENTLALVNLPFHPALVWEYHPTPAEMGGFSEYITNEERGYHAFKALYTNQAPGSHRPDGLLILDDTMTKGALAAAQTLGIEIGKDVHVATHANCGTPILRSYRDRLTLLEINVPEMVELMFQLLERAWSGTTPPGRASLLSPILGQSTAARAGSISGGPTP